MGQPKRRGDEQELLAKIRTRPPERVAEAAFAKVWDHPDDADYDRL